MQVFKLQGHQTEDRYKMTVFGSDAPGRMFFCVFLSFLLVNISLAKTVTTVSYPADFQCQNGEISSIECKKRWFGIPSCEDKTLVCEQKSHCCPKPASPATHLPIVGDCTTMANGVAETVEDSTLSITNTGNIGVSGCEKCDIVARHSCFLSLHIESNATVGELNNPDCLACENCCDDAFPHKCEVWKNHDFCDMSWYSRDKKLILCGKTCGLC